MCNCKKNLKAVADSNEDSEITIHETVMNNKLYLRQNTPEPESLELDEDVFGIEKKNEIE